MVKIEVVQVAHPIVHLTVAVVVEQHPFQLLIVPPFNELREFISHEAELLAGMRHHEAVKRAQILELCVVFAGHLVDERALSVHDLVVRQRQDKVLGIGVGHREGQVVVAALAPERVERHILQHIVHPAHIPFEEEAEAAVVIGLGDHWEGRGFLRRRDGVAPHGEHRAVQLAQEGNGLEIFAPAEFIRAEVAAAVVQIEHGRHGVDPQAVDMILLEPVDRVGDQEGLHLALAEVENARRPVGVLVHHRVGQLIAARSVEFVKTVLVLREVRRNPVEQHADTGAVALIHKSHELLRRAVARGRGVVARDLIAPRGIVGIFGDRHQLHMGVAHVQQIRDQLVGQLVVAVAAAVGLASPRAEVHLIDVHRTVEQMALGLLTAIGRVVPLEALERADAVGCIRQGAGAEAVRIGLIDR